MNLLTTMRNMEFEDLATRTPQQNGVVKRKNRIVKEMARTMLDEANIPDIYWKEAVHTAIYTLNWVQLRVNSRMTPYELGNESKPSLKHFSVCGSKCFIKKYVNGLGSFDSRSEEGIFLGYSANNTTYKF